MMDIISDIDYVLHNDFKCRENHLEEKGEDFQMSIRVNMDGCKAVLYKFDKQLDKSYKGGLFPFFAKKENVCKVSDYMLFAEKKGTLYVIIIEMKRGKSQTFPQLKAATDFANYVIATVNRVKGTAYKPEIRWISIHGTKIKKKKTKEKGITYDQDRHYVMRSNVFNVKLYLV